MINSKAILLVPFLLAILSCETSPLGSSARNSPAAPVTNSSDLGVNDLSLTQLRHAELPKGECGMVLWTLDADRPAAIFRYVSGGEAAIMLNRKEVRFPLENATGAAGFGVYEEMHFLSETGSRISVRVRFGLGFDGGSYLERGLVTVENPNGWKSVTPAAGIAGCRSK